MNTTLWIVGVFLAVAYLAAHARRKEYSNLPINVVFAAAAMFVAAGRF